MFAASTKMPFLILQQRWILSNTIQCERGMQANLLCCGLLFWMCVVYLFEESIKWFRGGRVLP